MRKKITILTLPSKNMFHVCCHDILAGVNNDAWYPYVPGELFKYVEKLLVEANEAANLVSLDKLNVCGESENFKAIYNAIELPEEPKLKEFIISAHFDGGEVVTAKVLAPSEFLAANGLEQLLRINCDIEAKTDFYIDTCTKIEDLETLKIS